ncbi:MAG TPA: transglutaminase-like domain-containing protein, partial [Roseiflexaceae bacterium]|nr:transglutaminase-like domain-containing protein [Roseiflexaceae bacterium]
AQDLLARRRLQSLLRLPENQLDLAEAALCIAWEDQGAGDPRGALHRLDAIAEAARPRIKGLIQPPNIVGALNGYLFDELGFRGNTWSYGDPENSFLDYVLEARAGLPILLALIYIEVGRRLGLPIVGLALPGIFLARYVAPEIGDLLIDPFNGGRLWTRTECETQVAGFYGSVTPALIEQVMEPPSKHAILARILRNLKSTYIERGDIERALAAVERIILIEPENIAELRDRGLLRARLGRLHSALEDLDRYARLAPTAADLPQIRQHARDLAKRLAEGN